MTQLELPDASETQDETCSCSAMLLTDLASFAGCVLEIRSTQQCSIVSLLHHE